MFPDDQPRPADCGDVAGDVTHTDKLEVILLATFTSIAFVVSTVACGYYFSRYKHENAPSLKPGGRANETTSNPILNIPQKNISQSLEYG